jgi:carotenoid cleavage dioxygenase-like enzyme
MVHSVHLHSGGAVAYRSRWVVTDTVAERRGVDPAPGPRNGGPDIIASNNCGANTPTNPWSSSKAPDSPLMLNQRGAQHTFRLGQPSELVIVADAARPGEADAGWLVGFVHHATGAGARTEVVVLDAADVARPPVATIPLPRPVPRGLHSTWIPSTQDGPSAR